MKREITISKLARDIGSCAICMARNYDASVQPAIGHKVDTLYDLDFGSANGSTIVRLCPDCLGALREEINATLS